MKSKKKISHTVKIGFFEDLSGYSSCTKDLNNNLEQGHLLNYCNHYPQYILDLVNLDNNNNNVNKFKVKISYLRPLSDENNNNNSKVEGKDYRYMSLPYCDIYLDSRNIDVLKKSKVYMSVSYENDFYKNIVGEVNKEKENYEEIFNYIFKVKNRRI